MLLLEAEVAVVVVTCSVAGNENIAFILKDNDSLKTH